MGSIKNQKVLDSVEAFDVFEELMENLKYIKDMVEDSEVVDKMNDISSEAIIFTDVINQKLNTLENKAKKVGKVMNRMFSSIDEGNMILDETMKDIKYNRACEKEISNNLCSVSKKLETVEHYSKRINK